MQPNFSTASFGMVFSYILLPVISFFLVLLVALFWPVAYANYVASETGVLEMLHIVVPLVGAYFAVCLTILFFSRKNRFGLAFSVFALFVCIYIAGEEASYGQHFFGWQAGEVLSQINDQQETNLHNISSWFDQKPRVILEIAIILGGLLLPIFPSVFMRLLPPGLRAYAPSVLFIPVAVW